MNVYDIRKLPGFTKTTFDRNRGTIFHFGNVQVVHENREADYTHAIAPGFLINDIDWVPDIKSLKEKLK